MGAFFASLGAGIMQPRIGETTILPGGTKALAAGTVGLLLGGIVLIVVAKKKRWI